MQCLKNVLKMGCALIHSILGSLCHKQPLEATAFFFFLACMNIFTNQVLYLHLSSISFSFSCLHPIMNPCSLTTISPQKAGDREAAMSLALSLEREGDIALILQNWVLALMEYRQAGGKIC